MHLLADYKKRFNKADLNSDDIAKAAQGIEWRNTVQKFDENLALVPFFGAFDVSLGLYVMRLINGTTPKALEVMTSGIVNLALIDALKITDTGKRIIAERSVKGMINEASPIELDIDAYLLSDARNVFDLLLDRGEKTEVFVCAMGVVGIYQMSMIFASLDGSSLWRAFPDRSLCADCIQMNGQVRKNVEWIQIYHDCGLRPQSTILACGGLECLCGFFPG